MVRDQAVIVFRQEAKTMCLWIEDDSQQLIDKWDEAEVYPLRVGRPAGPVDEIEEEVTRA